MTTKELTYKIIGSAMEVHKTLGSGFLESVYQEALCIELDNNKIAFKKEVPLKIKYKNTALSKEYYADIICEDDIILELKAVSSITKEHIAQTLHYLKTTNKELGLILNFGASSLEYKRIINTKKEA